MKRASFADEQIIGNFVDHETSAKRADLRRKRGMSEGNFSNRKATIGGMTVPKAKPLKTREDWNAKLKKLLAEQMLDLAPMKELIPNTVTPAVKREASAHLKALFGLSERRAYRLVRADHTLIRYQARRAPHTELHSRLRDIADERSPSERHRPERR